VWPLPERALLLIGASVPDALKITRAAQQLGFVVDADDPRRRIAACPGAPACLSGLIPARALAAALAPVLASIDPGSPRRTQAPRGAIPQDGGDKFAALLRELAAMAVEQVRGQRRHIALHISGCPKGCAHPLPAALTVVGTAGGCGVIHHGTAGEAPRQYLDPASLGDDIRRSAAQTNEAAHG
jgi:precorrin-3B synthase